MGPRLPLAAMTWRLRVRDERLRLTPAPKRHARLKAHRQTRREETYTPAIRDEDTKMRSAFNAFREEDLTALVPRAPACKGPAWIPARHLCCTLIEGFAKHALWKAWRRIRRGPALCSMHAAFSNPEPCCFPKIRYQGLLIKQGIFRETCITAIVKKRLQM